MNLKSNFENQIILFITFPTNFTFFLVENWGLPLEMHPFVKHEDIKIACIKRQPINLLPLLKEPEWKPRPITHLKNLHITHAVVWWMLFMITIT